MQCVVPVKFCQINKDFLLRDHEKCHDIMHMEIVRFSDVCQHFLCVYIELWSFLWSVTEFTEWLGHVKAGKDFLNRPENCDRPTQ